MDKIMSHKRRDASPSSSSEDDKDSHKVEQKTDQIHNVNRMPAKNLKISELSISEDGDSPEPSNDKLNRREREAMEAQRKREAYMKATMEGKTDQAKADLARLAIIRKQREEAAKKRQEELSSKQKVSGSKGESLTAGKAIITKSFQ